jgi:hypothetical protein
MLELRRREDIVEEYNRQRPEQTPVDILPLSATLINHLRVLSRLQQLLLECEGQERHQSIQVEEKKIG